MWGNKNPEQKNNAPAKAPEPIAAAIPAISDRNRCR